MRLTGSQQAQVGLTGKIHPVFVLRSSVSERKVFRPRVRYQDPCSNLQGSVVPYSDCFRMRNIDLFRTDTLVLYCGVARYFGFRSSVLVRKVVGPKVEIFSKFTRNLPCVGCEFTMPCATASMHKR